MLTHKTNNEREHFHLLRISDKNYNLLKEQSKIQNTSKSAILNHIISDFAVQSAHPASETPADHYALLQNSLQILSEAVLSLKPAPSILLSKCAEIWLDEKRTHTKSSSIRTYKQHITNHILPALGAKSVCDISRQDILKLQDDVAKATTPGYSNSVIKTLKAIFKTALTYEYISKDLSAGIKLLKETKSTARDNIHRALTKTEEHHFLQELSGDHLYLFILFLLSTGLRQGEASALKTDDIDENFIYVNRTMTVDEYHKVKQGDSPKTFSSKRIIPINDKIRSILNQIDMPEDGSTIFKSVHGKEVSNSAVNRAIKNTLKRLEKKDIHIDHFTSHAFRDTFATNYAQAHRDEGGDLETLKEILGHAKLSITADLYVHVLDDTKQRGMKRLDEVTE